jgi:hypothetical protein
MPSEIEPVFARLRSILQKHSLTLSENENTSMSYSLAGTPGPATLNAWGGKMKRPVIPVAWVQIGKSYVSYHLMGVCDNAKLRDTMSKGLQARMQGKTCFNFNAVDERLFAELDQLTGRSIAAFRKAGFVVD